MTKIKAITGQFDFHVDAQYYGFQWAEDMYITVDYTAIKDNGQVVASVNKISATPWLIGSIAIRGNWIFVDKEIVAAAQDHAEKEFAKYGVHPVIMESILPHFEIRTL